MSNAFEERGDWIRVVLNLEAERVREMALLAAGLSEEGSIHTLDRQIDGALAALSRRGVRYPGHFVAERYGLSGGEYLVLTLALLPHHRPDILTEIGQRTNMTCRWPTLSLLAHVTLPPGTPMGPFGAQLRQLPLCVEGVVSLSDGDDPELHVHRAVLDLFGLE